MNTYDKPAYRNYNDSAKQWQEWKNQAHEIRLTRGLSEVRRHASVSTTHRCGCKNCFCCACVEYVREQESEVTA